jgi:cyclic-di-GMP-binding protein
MSLNFNLPSLDSHPYLIAETIPAKIVDFTFKLQTLHPTEAGTQLLEELQALNRQKCDPKIRFNALETYKQTVSSICDDLEDFFNSAVSPLTGDAKVSADLASLIWHEFGIAYKRTLFDIQNQLLNFNSNSMRSLIIHRILSCLQKQTIVHYLTYTSPTPNCWAELHQIYYLGLQQSLEDEVVSESFFNNAKSINLVYIQTLLIYLANPQKLDKASILNVVHYAAHLAKYVQLHGIGHLQNQVGVFIVELDSTNPPLPFAKNKNTPNVNTDILLLTVEVARQIHQQLKFLREHQSDSLLQANQLLDVVDENLLIHLINNFGIPPNRVFNRREMNDELMLAIGISNANSYIKHGALKSKRDAALSRWVITNTSPTGYALTMPYSESLALKIGDVVVFKESKNKYLSLAYIIWINAENESIDIGLSLIGINPRSCSVQTTDKTNFEPAILLDEIEAIQQPITLVVKKNQLKPNSETVIKLGNKKITATLLQKQGQTALYERFAYRLTDVNLS